MCDVCWRAILPITAPLCDRCGDPLGTWRSVPSAVMVQEIAHLIEQMDDSERRTYLAESLFLNTVKYENDKLEAYMKRLTKK